MIIDFHTHVFPEKIAKKTVEVLAEKSNNPPHSDGTVSGLISALGEAGADVAINLPVITKAEQFESVLQFASALNARKYEGERIISFAGIHPDIDDPFEKLSEVKRCGILGIKIHPDYQNTYIDDDRYVRIFEAAKRLGLIVVTHSGLDGAYVGQPIKCTPRRVLNLLDKIGGYEKLVLAHIGANEMFDEVYSELCGLDVYFDTAYSLHGISEDLFKKILEKQGDGKILFDTDSPWQSIKSEADIIKGFKLGGDTERKIFSENALKILGI